MYTYLYSMMKNIFAVLALLVATSAVAQEEDARQESVSRLLHDIEYKVEMQGSFSKGKTPLWLNANKFGLSSLDKTNGYLRGAIERPLKADEGRKWGVGYGVDLAVPVNIRAMWSFSRLMPRDVGCTERSLWAQRNIRWN